MFWWGGIGLLYIAQDGFLLIIIIYVYLSFSFTYHFGDTDNPMEVPEDVQSPNALNSDGAPNQFATPLQQNNGIIFDNSIVNV